jgi:hypothetical protein
MLEKVYINKNFEINKGFQAVIDSPNVIVYFATKKLCEMPSEICYERIGSYNHHFIYTPSEELQQKGMFLIKAADTCTFTLTLVPLSSEFVDLRERRPFSYMFEEQEKELKFRFTR